MGKVKRWDEMPLGRLCDILIAGWLGTPIKNIAESQGYSTTYMGTLLNRYGIRRYQTRKTDEHRAAVRAAAKKAWLRRSAQRGQERANRFHRREAESML